MVVNTQYIKYYHYAYTMELEELVAFRIRKARRESDLTQAQAGELIGINQQTWASYETGKRGVSLKALGEIARALGKPVSYFVDEDFEAMAKAPLPKDGSHAVKADWRILKNSSGLDGKLLATVQAIPHAAGLDETHKLGLTMRTQYYAIAPSQLYHILKARFGIREILNRLFQRLWLFHFSDSLKPCGARLAI